MTNAEKIEGGKTEIDPDAEIRTLTYTIAELQGGTPGCVISQPHAVRYFEKENPELVVKRVYGFKMNHEDQTVTLKVKVTKRKYVVGVDMAAKGESRTVVVLDEFATLPDHKYFQSQVEKAPIPESEPITQGHKVECECGECKLNRDLRKITTDALDKLVDENPLPITDPARLLNAGQAAPAGETRVEELEKENATLKSTIEKVGNGNFSVQGIRTQIHELEKENATLKSAIEKFGNGQDFDWNVLARIEVLEAACNRYLTQIELGGPKLLEQVKNLTTYNMIKDAMKTSKPNAGEQDICEPTIEG